MDIVPDYSLFYKTLSNAELLDILENPGSYHAAALESAKKELSNRQLSEEEIADAKGNLLEKQHLSEKKDQKRKTIQDKIDHKGNSIIASFNPNQEGISKNEKSIRFITIGLSALFLIYLVRDFTMIQFSIKYMSDMPGEAIAVALPIIILPLALFLFWKRNPAGWRLLAIWLTYSILENAAYFLSFDDSGPLDYLLPTPSMSGVIINLVIVCGALLTICQGNVREEFTISRKNMISILVLSVVFSMFFSFLLAIV